MELKAAQTKSHLLSIFINKKIPQAKTTYVTISRLSETLIGIDIPTLMRCNIFPVQNINNLLLVSIFWKGYIIISFWDNASDRSWKKHKIIPCIRQVGSEFLFHTQHHNFLTDSQSQLDT